MGLDVDGEEAMGKHCMTLEEQESLSVVSALKLVVVSYLDCPMINDEQRCCRHSNGLMKVMH